MRLRDTYKSVGPAFLWALPMAAIVMGLVYGGAYLLPTIGAPLGGAIALALIPAWLHISTRR